MELEHENLNLTRNYKDTFEGFNYKYTLVIMDGVLQSLTCLVTPVVEASSPEQPQFGFNTPSVNFVRRQDVELPDAVYNQVLSDATMHNRVKDNFAWCISQNSSYLNP